MLKGLYHNGQPVYIYVCLLISLTLSGAPLLQVLAGEEADITSSMLSTEDADTAAEELVYHVESPENGMVSLKESPDEEALNFTQAQVNSGEVIFIHQGKDFIRSSKYRCLHVNLS